MKFPHGGVFLHPQETAKKSVVLLHGYGASGENISVLGQEWKDNLPSCVFWAPDAIELCEEVPVGFQWFPLYDRALEKITPGLNQAAEIVAKAIQDHMVYFSLTPKDIVVVGFSQGAMLALELLWRIEDLGGVIAYSGRSYDQHKDKASKNPTPVLLVHGTQDEVVPFYHLSNAQKLLISQKFSVDVCICDGLGHFIDKKGMCEGLLFLNKVFSDKKEEKTT
jgi:phospholipase/carboxylesterase